MGRRRRRTQTGKFAFDAVHIALRTRHTGLEFGHAVQVHLVVAELGAAFFRFAVVVFGLQTGQPAVGLVQPPLAAFAVAFGTVTSSGIVVLPP